MILYVNKNENTLLIKILMLQIGFLIFLQKGMFNKFSIHN